MRYLIFVLLLSTVAYSQVPPITPGVSQELAKWRAAHYSDVRYKLNLTLEKMSPVLKGTIEIRVGVRTLLSASAQGAEIPPIILDWRRIKGHEDKSTISKVTLNGREVQSIFTRLTIGPGLMRPPRKSATPDPNPIPTPLPSRLPPVYRDADDHLVFTEGVQLGENVIKLDFTSPILTSGAGITRYIDKEDGSEYIYSLFVPSDASTAFPVFDQPDLKARFETTVMRPKDWDVIANALGNSYESISSDGTPREYVSWFVETKPISTYVFAFAAGPFHRFWAPSKITRDVRPELKEAYKRWINNDVSILIGGEDVARMKKEEIESLAKGHASDSIDFTKIYVRRSQAAKFKPHAAEVFRLNRESIKYFEEYFDYKFPFPKYDLVLIPEFPFGGMEHAGATFLRESAIIFPQEPTKSDHISRAVLIFHEAAHQWFGDTVTMKWFDDLWLKEGFANFMAYKAVDKIMPDANAWKVFYERIKQPAYATDSTRGTTPIYQPIDNLNSAKSAYGNIVYNKAPAFLKQAEFYLGADKFQTAVRAFLKKYEFKNAQWEDLVTEFEGTLRPSDGRPYWKELSRAQRVKVAKRDAEALRNWADSWIKLPGVPTIKVEKTEGHWEVGSGSKHNYTTHSGLLPALGLRLEPRFERSPWGIQIKTLYRFGSETEVQEHFVSGNPFTDMLPRQSGSDGFPVKNPPMPDLIFPNYGDYGYGVFLLDDTGIDYVVRNIEKEQDPFLRSMMWGSLWDSVREGAFDPRQYVNLVINPTIGQPPPIRKSTDVGGAVFAETDETVIQSLLARASMALKYFVAESAESERLNERFESMLVERIQNAPSSGLRVTYFRALVANATSDKGRAVLKAMLAEGRNLSGSEGAPQQASTSKGTLPTGRVSALVLRTKDKFDIVTRLAVLNDPDAAKLLAELEKTETSDDAERYAYAARAAFPTKENREKYWNDFVNNKDISESWIEAAFGPFNAVRNSELSLPFLRRALEELPNHKRSRKIFFVNGWLAAFIGGQRSQEALDIVNKFLGDNPNLDKDLRLKILENVDIIERAVRIRGKFKNN
ncbi:MAG: ERAP1-like C-terminal domain-containing protein [Blastocatellia bacterium]|nr:ERAP1-like C-terminal domain-containing protein [Blastocatellia bacterium]